MHIYRLRVLNPNTLAVTMTAADEEVESKNNSYKITSLNDNSYKIPSLNNNSFDLNSWAERDVIFSRLLSFFITAWFAMMLSLIKRDHDSALLRILMQFAASALRSKIKLHKASEATEFRLAGNAKRQFCMRAMLCHHDTSEVEAGCDASRVAFAFIMMTHG